MRNWLRRKLHQFIFNDSEVSRGSTANLAKASVRESNDVDIEGMRFTVMVAEGGTIMQMRTYDRRKDESHTKTYVIPDNEQDIAHRVGQIVALELIRA